MALRDKISLQDLTLADVKCPICLSILIEPVTMPCSHTLCMPCFVQNVAQTALACPLCRKRISVWVRRSSKANKLVDKRLWDKIQEKFSSLIEARLHDEDDFIIEDTSVPKPQVCEPGEIRQEYEALLAQQEQERSLRRTEEEIASSRLIQQLQDEEKMKLRERREHQLRLCENDEAVAQKYKEEEKKKKQPAIISPVPSKKGSHTSSKSTSTPTRGPMDVFIGQKTPSSSSKRATPRMGYSSGSTSSEIYFGSPERSNTVPDRSIRDVNSTPTTSSFSPVRRRSIHMSSADSPRRLNKEKGVSYDSMATRIGRQLREITSSQSSESESEDVSLSSSSRYKKSGKENVGNSGKSGKVKVKNKEWDSHRIFSECSPDIDEYCGLKRDSSRDNSRSRLEDSDETDIEDDAVESTSALRRLHDQVENDEESASYAESNLRIAVSNENGARLSEQSKVSATMSGHSSETLIPNEVLDFESPKSDDISSLIKEQQLLEARIQQEEADRLLAEALQRELNQRPQVNRSRGSEDEYSLRDRNPASKKADLARSPSTKSTLQPKVSPNQTKKRQSTLMESLKKRQKT
ncbi:E3 ubiquitin-protein ligase rnf168-like isoform X2 [Penaeus japonicus]|uniref:E3 ubiquitin-protein ligase rnf168-like isoform X2 n=1 Tax=Penaeus japonicus TaxID=27405 RepID=UPI001C713ED5|nr:E3 ubiquitin-protein ligase rnf168-like isoform X2 [Penaeus japonicus]